MVSDHITTKFCNWKFKPCMYCIRKKYYLELWFPKKFGHICERSLSQDPPPPCSHLFSPGWPPLPPLVRTLFMNGPLVYGFDEKSISWFRSYLTNRQQVVMIEDVISDPVTINVGSPQGAILSPTIFIILISDIGLYNRHFDTKNITRSHRSSSTGCYCELHTKITSCYNESRSCLNSIF